jgi:hypothetical protein
MHEGFAIWAEPGAPIGASELAAVAADVLLQAGRIDDAETFVRIGEKAQAESPENFFAAELLRLRALLSRSAGDPAAAELGLRRALDIAKRQHADLFVLRAADALAQLLQAQDRPAEAEAVLRPAVNAMTEGLEQPDMLRARATLQQLCMRRR